MHIRERIQMVRGEDITLRFSIVDPSVRTKILDGGDGIDVSQATIAVISTSGFSSTGRIKIRNEIIQYTGITATTFTGCTRGGAVANGGEYSAEPHKEGEDVYQVSNVSGWTTEIDVRETADTVAAAIEKAGSVLSDVNGLIDVALVAADTSAETPDTYVYEFRRTDSSNVTVLANGAFVLKQEVSR